jgi:ABC-type Mn2+/Zn2+ transport system permease subunit
MLNDALITPFASDFMQRALIVALLVGVLAPVVGTWVVLRRMANLGDAMGHGTLAGVGLAFALGVDVLIGALGAGVAMAVVLATLPRDARIGHEANVSIVGVALFAIGIIVVSHLRTGVELTHFLFGRILTVDTTDVVVNIVLTAGALTVVAVLFGDLRLATFDPVHASQVGVHVRRVDTVLLVLLAITIVISLKTVGTLMATALLVAPAATARLLTRDAARMTAAGAAIGVVTVVTGLLTAYHLDSAPGATIALVATSGYLLTTALVRFGHWRKSSTAAHHRRTAVA